MSSMRAVLVRKPGEATELELGEAPRPQIAADEVLVKVVSFGLNRMDIVQRKGFYPPPKGASDILGVEFSGHIEQIGGDVRSVKVGDKVMGLVGGGAYSEYVAVNQAMVMPIPHSFSFVQAAAIPETWFTAYQAIHFVTEFKAGETILIHGGASGVGTAAIQLAKLAKADKIIVTAGSDDKTDFCKSLGATHGINYKTEDFQAKVLEYTGGKGANVIIDMVGAQYWDKNLGALALDGRMVMLAFLGGSVIKESNLAVILKHRLRIQGSTLRSRSLEYQIELRNAIVANVIPKLESGDLKPIVDREYSWKDIVAAHQYMESNQSIGKIIVNID
ncbi:quinone oxidoreductase [Polychytrium aggregatum]|uniref:quinone oxidoreductase n=1 Tax=Polychytrium aggregatum TaxID=110093 RepID=UPI0022FE4376|nr:quinone oxidoreductase [Polychytrium aggregatum]KAI9204406.1 quinone oxidoreductase [Polychytrium aggregatum]